MNTKDIEHLKHRFIAGSIGIVCMLVGIYISHYPLVRPLFALATAAVIGSAVWEYYKIAKVKGFRPMTSIGIGGATTYVIATFLTTFAPETTLLPMIILGLTFLFLFIYFFAEGSDPFANLAITTFGIVYLVVPLSCWLNINYFFPEGASQDGRWWLLYLLSITKMTDIGAYFSGKIFGRKKLAPYISPQKTWIGAIGGLMMAILASFLFHKLSLTGVAFTLHLETSLCLGALIAILAQIGDLAESLLKRDAGVKDSNRLPGLGGMLDMVDSLVFTTPLIYLYLLAKAG